MANQKRKSIAEIISKPLSKKPSSAEIEKITTKIHEPKNSGDITPITLSIGEKMKRISTSVPVSLYLKAKTKSTLQEQTLLEYISSLIEKDVAN